MKALSIASVCYLSVNGQQSIEISPDSGSTNESLYMETIELQDHQNTCSDCGIKHSDRRQLESTANSDTTSTSSPLLVDLKFPGGFSVKTDEDGSFMMKYTHSDGTTLEVNTTDVEISLKYENYAYKSKIESFVINELVEDPATPGFVKSEPYTAQIDISNA